MQRDTPIPEEPAPPTEKPSHRPNVIDLLRERPSEKKQKGNQRKRPSLSRKEKRRRKRQRKGA